MPLSHARSGSYLYTHINFLDREPGNSSSNSTRFSIRLQDRSFHPPLAHVLTIQDLEVRSILRITQPFSVSGSYYTQLRVSIRILLLNALANFRTLVARLNLSSSATTYYVPLQPP